MLPVSQNYLIVTIGVVIQLYKYLQIPTTRKKDDNKEHISVGQTDKDVLVFKVNLQLFLFLKGSLSTCTGTFLPTSEFSSLVYFM